MDLLMHPLILQSGPARNILVLSHKSRKSCKKPKNLDASQSGMHGYLHQIEERPSAAPPKRGGWRWRRRRRRLCAGTYLARGEDQSRRLWIAYSHDHRRKPARMHRARKREGEAVAVARAGGWMGGQAGPFHSSRYRYRYRYCSRALLPPSRRQRGSRGCPGYSGDG